jgi:DNA-binding LacI/PurR family transcriptional regulator
MIATYGASQHLVQGALEQLRSEGLITSHVGRGTFTASAGEEAPKRRNVLTLLFHHPYERGDRIAQLIHQQLSLDGHNSLVLTYSNTKQVMEILRGGGSFDACVLQPRSSVVPISLLALLKQRAEHLIIESLAAEHLDIDAVSNDPGTCVELALGHLAERGYRSILWVTEAGENYFFRRLAEIFHAYCCAPGAVGAGSRIVQAETKAHGLGIADLPATLASLGVRRDTGVRTAVVIASFVDGSTILEALESCGLSAPEDLALLRIGTPDLETDHAGRITTVGRPSTQAAQTILERLYRRWNEPAAPWQTFYDTPSIAEFASTQSRSAADRDEATSRKRIASAKARV